MEAPLAGTMVVRRRHRVAQSPMPHEQNPTERHWQSLVALLEARLKA